MSILCSLLVAATLPQEKQEKEGENTNMKNGGEGNKETQRTLLDRIPCFIRYPQTTS